MSSENPSQRARSLLAPKRIAVVGASSSPGYASRICENILASGGALYPVNPKYDNLFGRKCYRRISELPNEIDSAAVVIPAPFVPDLLKECGEKKVKNIVIVSGGFTETGEDGRRLQVEIQDIAKKFQLNICGPNCVGFLNTRGPSVFGLDYPKVAGHVGIVSQSGGLLSAVLKFDELRHIGFSYAISAGNECVLEASEYISALLEDPDTFVVSCILEEIQVPRAIRAGGKRCAS